MRGSRRFWVGVLILLGLVLGLASTSRGEGIADSLRKFLEYYSGVFALVGFTAVVVNGLAATDRLVGSITLRILLQAVHRALAVASTGFLATHITLKIMEAHARPIQAVVPIGNRYWVDIGVIASDLLIIVLATGVFRMRFARRPRMWRVLHASAYLWWPMGIFHGLKAGRPPKDWVTLSYELCAAAVALALLLRILMAIGPRGRRALRARTIRRSTPAGGPPPVPEQRGPSDEDFWTYVRGGTD